MAIEKDFYSIVVAGTMNPRLHSPAWYQLVGAISESEMNEAVTSDLVSLPMISKWQVKDFSMVCQLDRWELQTSDASALDRLQLMVGRMFDELLEHTLVSALGFNFNYAAHIGRPDAGKQIASLLATPQIGLKPDCLVAGHVLLKRFVDGRSVSVHIRVPDGQESSSVVSVSNNYEYAFGSATLQKLCLGRVIADRFSQDRQDAESQTSLVMRSIRAASETT